MPDGAKKVQKFPGYECFKKVVAVTKPIYVSCIIQINVDDSFVSDSPYLHAFDGLGTVHHQMAEQELQNSMNEIDSQRLLDCASGAIYALNGNIRRVDNNIFLLTPEGFNIRTPENNKNAE